MDESASMSEQEKTFSSGQFRRLALSLSFLIGLGAVGFLFAQDQVINKSEVSSLVQEPSLSGESSIGRTLSSNQDTEISPQRQSSGAEALLNSSPKPDTSQEVQEILELRQSLGGSVLDGLDLGPDAEKIRAEMQMEFQKEMVRLANENASREAAQRAASNSKLKRNGALPLISGISQQQKTSSIIGFVSEANQSSISVDQVKVMRKIARQMEELAWELESTESYQHADRLRDQSRRIREQCRQTISESVGLNRHR